MFDKWCWAQWYVLVVMLIEILAGIGKATLEAIINGDKKDGEMHLFIASVIHIIMTVFMIYALHVGGFW